MPHANAPLTRTGRHRMVRLVEEEGLTFEAAAAASNVAKSTVHLWVSRWRSASAGERASLACLEDRSSRPRRSPARLSAAAHDRVCQLRRRTGWGPRLIASELGVPHATVHRALARRGCSRAPRAPREPARRYEWPCPGNLLHMDTKRHARFVRPGHALTGDRARRSAGAGWEFVHTIVDDCSRLAYAEVHRDERAATVCAFSERALDWFAERGIVAERLLTDNHFSYTKSRQLAELLRRRAVEHWTTRPYTPRTNGKVERLQQTMDREWARGLTYRSSADRRAALPHWLDHYNRARRTPRSATGHPSSAFGTSWGTTASARPISRDGGSQPPRSPHHNDSIRAPTPGNRPPPADPPSIAPRGGRTPRPTGRSIRPPPQPNPIQTWGTIWPTSGDS